MTDSPPSRPDADPLAGVVDRLDWIEALIAAVGTDVRALTAELDRVNERLEERFDRLEALAARRWPTTTSCASCLRETPAGRRSRPRVEADARFDGIFVLRTNTELSPLMAMLRYKQLWTVEQTFRSAKSLLATRPIFHKLDETIPSSRS